MRFNFSLQGFVFSALVVAAGWLSPGCGSSASCSAGLFRPAAAVELRGESELLYEVARDDLIAERVDEVRGEVRKRLRDAAIAHTGLTGSAGQVQVRISDAADLDRARAALAGLLTQTPGAPVVELQLSEPEPGLLNVELGQAGIDHRVGLAADGTFGVFARRIHALGLTDPVIEKQGIDGIRVIVGGLLDPEALKEILGRRSRLTLQLVDTSMTAEEALAGQAPAGSSVLHSAGDFPMAYLVEDEVLLSGERLVDAQASLDQYTGQPVITFRFDDEGKRLFGEITARNVGRAIAVIVDGQILMAPVIREPILGGSGQISGALTAESARDLALLLRTGPLPAKLDLLESRFRPVEP